MIVKKPVIHAGSINNPSATCPTSTGEVIKTSSGANRSIALTFDDGPSPVYTQQFLDVLNRNHVKATFFLVGKHVEMYPAQAKQIAADGMWIGNHTYHHPSGDQTPDPRMMDSPSGQFDQLPEAVQADEIDTTTAVIRTTTGIQPCWFRAPGGYQFSATTQSLAQARNLANVYWSNNNTLDFAQPEYLSNIYQNYMVFHAEAPWSAHPIILMHDNEGRQIVGYAYRANDVPALARIIAYYRSMGYAFVSPTGQTS